MPARPYLIANPIYDAVIKALLDDAVIARGFLSVLLGLPIVSLRLVSREVPARSPARPGDADDVARPLPGTLRMDFCAIIRTVTGVPRQVLIEVQKTRLSGDILRFRHYLANRYATLEEVEIGDGDGLLRPEPLPLLCVYLLGFEADPRLPMVTRVERRYLDAVSGLPLDPAAFPAESRPALLEGLTHDAWFIQIPRIRGRGPTALERLLSVFDQSLRVQGDAHRLDYAGGDEKLGDDLLRRILRRLHKFQTDPDMERIMSAEDVFELEQQRIHEDLARDLAREQKLRQEADRLREKEQCLREEEQRRREAAELEVERLRRLLDETGSD